MLYGLNDLIIDTEARTVHRDKTTLKLPDLSFDLLVSLIAAAPEPLNNKEISTTTWSSEHVSDQTISQRVTLLRKALGDDPKHPIYIRTIRGKGYAICGTVDLIEDKNLRDNRWFSTKPNLIAVTVVLSLLAGAGMLFWRAPGFGLEHEAIAEQHAPKTTVDILIDRAGTQLSLHQFRETDRAITMLRKALVKVPGNADARLMLSVALSTKATKFDGDKAEEQEAEAIARALISEQPDNSKAWSALAYSLGAQGRMNESLPAYQRAYQLNPQNASALSSAAHIFLIQGNLQQALMLEMTAKQAGGNSRYAEIQIFQILEMIEHPAADEWREKALSLNPEQVVVLREIARSHLRKGNPTAALETLDQARGDDRFAPQIIQLRGRANISLGRVAEARQILGKAGWRGQYDLAALDARSGDNALANSFFKAKKLETIESDPDPESRISLAEIKSAQGDIDQAAQLLTQAVSLGWRDIGWLKQSPFLGELMSSDEGRTIEQRIERELEAQRILVAGTDGLAQFLGS
jgi:DNA-binding winged helix-turn-helix (wHTH) protein/Flp pilus assembly protein TadD